MKKYLAPFFIALFVTFNLNAQVYEPVEWYSSVEKISDTEYNLIFTADIESNWHVYSQIISGEIGRAS